MGSVFVARPADAATIVTDLDHGVTAADLVGTLLGPNVSASSVTYNGANLSSGTFAGATSPVGFDKGIVLSSGDINGLVPGPNKSDDASTSTGSGPDPGLETLVGRPTYDKAVLEFDFTVSASKPTVDLSFDYVFASEEYNEYVKSEFNDVFGFFVDGYNCATIGDPAVSVSINTINNGNPYGSGGPNAALYRNNDLSDGGGTIDTELDGLTTVLTCKVTISSGGIHRVKLAIADVSDSSLDSAVFLRANSFTFTQDTKLTAEPAIAKVVPGAEIYVPNLTATLTTSEGVPVPAAVVDFRTGSTPLCTATTGADGVATCSATITQVLTVVTQLGYEAAFAGSGPYLASSAHAPIVAVGPLVVL